MSHTPIGSPNMSASPSTNPADPWMASSLSSSNSSSRASLKPGTPAGSPTERLKKSVLACNHCRQKKTKCSSHRPSCVSCLGSNRICVYASAPSDRAAGSREKRPEASPVLVKSDLVPSPTSPLTSRVGSVRSRSRRRSRMENQLGGPKPRQRSSHRVGVCTLSVDPDASRWTTPGSSAPSPMSRPSYDATASLSPLTSSSSSCPSSSATSTPSIPTSVDESIACESVDAPPSLATVDFNEGTYDHRAWSTTPAWLTQPTSSDVSTSPASTAYHAVPVYSPSTWPIPMTTASEVSPISTATPDTTGCCLPSGNLPDLDPYAYTPPSTTTSIASTFTNRSCRDHLSTHAYPSQLYTGSPFPPPENPFSSPQPEELFFSTPTYSSHHDFLPGLGEPDGATATEFEAEPEMEPEWGYPHTLRTLHQSLAIHVNPPVRKRMSDLWNTQSWESLVIDPLSEWR